MSRLFPGETPCITAVHYQSQKVGTDSGPPPLLSWYWKVQTLQIRGLKLRKRTSPSAKIDSYQLWVLRALPCAGYFGFRSSLGMMFSGRCTDSSLDSTFSCPCLIQMIFQMVLDREEWYPWMPLSVLNFNLIFKKIILKKLQFHRKLQNSAGKLWALSFTIS